MKNNINIANIQEIVSTKELYDYIDHYYINNHILFCRAMPKYFSTNYVVFIDQKYTVFKNLEALYLPIVMKNEINNNVFKFKYNKKFYTEFFFKSLLTEM